MIDTMVCSGQLIKSLATAHKLLNLPPRPHTIKRCRSRRLFTIILLPAYPRSI